MNCDLKSDPVRAVVFASFAVAFLLSFIDSASAADEPAAQKRTPLGQFVTIASPVDDAVFNRVSTAALRLQQ